MSYKLDAWSPSRVNSATVFSASSCSPHCSSRRTQTLLRNRSARSAARASSPTLAASLNAPAFSKKVAFASRHSIFDLDSIASAASIVASAPASSPVLDLWCASSASAWTRHDDGSFSFSFSFSPSPCAGGKAPVFSNVSAMSSNTRPMIAAFSSFAYSASMSWNSDGTPLRSGFSANARSFASNAAPDEYSNGNRLIVSHRGCFTPSSSYNASSLLTSSAFSDATSDTSSTPMMHLCKARWYSWLSGMRSINARYASAAPETSPIARSILARASIAPIASTIFPSLAAISASASLNFPASSKIIAWNMMSSLSSYFAMRGSSGLACFFTDVSYLSIAESATSCFPHRKLAIANEIQFVFCVGFPCSSCLRVSTKSSRSLTWICSHERSRKICAF
eukprot:31162-Pelagococcus_subviridis.AAC.8